MQSIEKNNQSLSRAMLANAAFSAFTGILTAGPNLWISDVLGTPYSHILRIFGILLLCHTGILLAIVFLGQSARWVKLNLTLISAYPALVIIAILAGFVKGSTGVAVSLLDAMVVGLIAIWQFRALNK